MLVAKKDIQLKLIERNLLRLSRDKAVDEIWANTANVHVFINRQGHGQMFNVLCVINTFRYYN